MTSIKKVKVFRLMLVLIIVLVIIFYAVNNYRLIIQVFNDKETAKQYLNTVIESRVVIDVYRDSLYDTVDTLKVIRIANDSLTKVNITKDIKIKTLSHEVHILSDSIHHINKRRYTTANLQPVE